MKYITRYRSASRDNKLERNVDGNGRAETSPVSLRLIRESFLKLKKHRTSAQTTHLSPSGRHVAMPVRPRGMWSPEKSLSFESDFELLTEKDFLSDDDMTVDSDDLSLTSTGTHSLLRVMDGPLPRGDGRGGVSGRHHRHAPTRHKQYTTHRHTQSNTSHSTQHHKRIILPPPPPPLLPLPPSNRIERGRELSVDSIGGILLAHGDILPSRGSGSSNSGGSGKPTSRSNDDTGQEYISRTRTDPTPTKQPKSPPVSTISPPPPPPPAAFRVCHTSVTQQPQSRRSTFLTSQSSTPVRERDGGGRGKVTRNPERASSLREQVEVDYGRNSDGEVDERRGNEWSFSSQGNTAKSYFGDDEDLRELCENYYLHRLAVIGLERWKCRVNVEQSLSLRSLEHYFVRHTTKCLAQWHCQAHFSRLDTQAGQWYMWRRCGYVFTTLRSRLGGSSSTMKRRSRSRPMDIANSFYRLKGQCRLFAALRQRHDLHLKYTASRRLATDHCDVHLLQMGFIRWEQWNKSARCQRFYMRQKRGVLGVYYTRWRRYFVSKCGTEAQLKAADIFYENYALSLSLQKCKEYLVEYQKRRHDYQLSIDYCTARALHGVFLILRTTTRDPRLQVPSQSVARLPPGKIKSTAVKAQGNIPPPWQSTSTRSVYTNKERIHGKLQSGDDPPNIGNGTHNQSVNGRHSPSQNHYAHVLMRRGLEAMKRQIDMTYLRESFISCAEKHWDRRMCVRAWRALQRNQSRAKERRVPPPQPLKNIATTANAAATSASVTNKKAAPMDTHSALEDKYDIVRAVSGIRLLHRSLMLWHRIFVACCHYRFVQLQNGMTAFLVCTTRKTVANRLFALGENYHALNSLRSAFMVMKKILLKYQVNRSQRS